MKRIALALLAVGLLLAGAVTTERALQKTPRPDPLGRRLLYLPTAEALHLMSLGNAGLVADLLYLWSIQYYSQFQPHERFLYLETVYNLITDLDRLYADAYRIGALIMQIQTGNDDAHKAAVVRLFDKGLRNLPANFELAEAAAWDMYIRYREMDHARRYIEAAVAMPGSPPRYGRALAVWREREGEWSFDSAVEYWEQAREEATNDYDRAVCERQIYRLYAARDEEQLEPLLDEWSMRHGECPDDWRQVVDAGWLRDVPVDYFGAPYEILPESCTAMAKDGVRLD